MYMAKPPSNSFNIAHNAKILEASPAAPCCCEPSVVCCWIACFVSRLRQIAWLGLPEPIEAPQIGRGDRLAPRIDGQCAILNSFLDANV